MLRQGVSTFLGVKFSQKSVQTNSKTNILEWKKGKQVENTICTKEAYSTGNKTTNS